VVDGFFGLMVSGLWPGLVDAIFGPEDRDMKEWVLGAAEPVRFNYQVQPNSITSSQLDDEPTRDNVRVPELAWHPIAPDVPRKLSPLRISRDVLGAFRHRVSHGEDLDGVAPAVSLCLCQVAAEARWNVARHAAATRPRQAHGAVLL
jgi:hypothetical protein